MGKAKTKAGKKRLDLLLVERGLVETRERAQALLLAGEVRVEGQRKEKAGEMVAETATIEIAGSGLRYVSRGGLKLEGALEDFEVAVSGKRCLDVGSSTGGFTDCLLQRGAAKVYAVDVNRQQLAWKLQQDLRVVMIEKNARYLKAEDVPEPVGLAAMDVSFISVTKILPAIAPLVEEGGEILVLVKPQFELEKKLVGKGGIVKEAALHERAVARVKSALEELGLEVRGKRPSRITGAEGNQEFFLLATKGKRSAAVSRGEPVE